MTHFAPRCGAALVPALLLQACASLSAPEETAYNGTIFSGGGLHPVTTVFTTDARDATLGRYVFQEDDGAKVPGTLGPCEVRPSGALRCEWQDRYGTGYFFATFTPDRRRFHGHWGSGDLLRSTSVEGIWTGER